MSIDKTLIKSGWNFNNSYAQLPKIFFQQQRAEPVRDPKLVKLNEQLAKELGINTEWLTSDEGIAELSGNRVPDGAAPLAQAYAGHQFGHFTMLGDGRALLLGEQITPDGKRLDIQLKGSGRTPFSRGGDGRAALGPMLREYIISEAMHALGIPTTRSLAVVTTGETIIREEPLTGAILTRIASSHIRVGTFQFVAQWGNLEQLKSLADYTIERHYPTIMSEQSEHSNQRYLKFLEAVIDRQASLIAQWQLVGFIHGVMNTDNMAIAGETIDYGPCAFMDTYNPATVFSSIDVNGRYAYGNQPYIGLWNLTRLAEALLPLFHDDQEESIKLAESALAQYNNFYQTKWLSGMRAKLGIYNEEEMDESLITELLEIMQTHQADFTNTFRSLTIQQWDDCALSSSEAFKQWLEKWKQRQARQDVSEEEIIQQMKQHNPAIIPRNHRVEEALEAAVEHNDYSVMEQFLEVLSDPYAYSAKQEPYTLPPGPTKFPYRTFCGT